MAKSIRHAIKDVINHSIAPLGLELQRTGAHDWTDQSSYIPFDATLAAAEKAGLPVGDYIDTVINNNRGATQHTIDEMARLGVFAAPIRTVVEIGPGSGRYLEKTIKACAPARYEVYETAKPWAAYVAQQYDAVSQPTGGGSLASTPTASVDLIQAHKVFSSITFMATCRYWPEMVRVTKPGGFAVFDLLTEDCLDPETVERWAASGIDGGSYPAAVPRRAATDYFTSRNFSLVGSFFVPMSPGRTEVLVFKKHTAI